MPKKMVRYAVVGLGHIAQVAVLPAFAHAAKNSRLTALVSGNAMKRKQLSARYDIPHTYSYREYDRCLREGEIDAVYIALPNNMHRDYAVRAARAGIHVLCEKPMAVTAAECAQMIQSARRGGVKLMIAYRLHFDEANMTAVQMLHSNKIGPPRLFNSTFTMQVRPGDIRVQRKFGGGPLYDIGIYCINAARYLFGEEPVEVSAFSASGADRRFKEVDEMTGAPCAFRKTDSRPSFAASARRTYPPMKSSARKDASTSNRHMNTSGRSNNSSRLMEKRRNGRFDGAINSRLNYSPSPIAS